MQSFGLIFSLLLLCNGCQGADDSIAANVLVKLDGAQQDDVSSTVKKKGALSLGAKEGTVNVSSTKIVPEVLYKVNSPCDAKSIGLIDKCSQPFKSLTSDVLAAFTKGFPAKIRETIREVYADTCDRIAVFKSCAADMVQGITVEKGPNGIDPCSIKSCVLNSVIRGCNQEADADRHFKCIFETVINKDVVKCFMDFIISPASEKGINDPDLWKHVIPQILTCVEVPVEEKCGQASASFLNSLVSPVVTSKNISDCPLLSLQKLSQHGTTKPKPLPTTTTTSKAAVITTASKPASSTTAPTSPEPSTARRIDRLTFPQAVEPTTSAATPILHLHNLCLLMLFSILCWLTGPLL